MALPSRGTDMSCMCWRAIPTVSCKLMVEWYLGPVIHQSWRLGLLSCCERILTGALHPSRRPSTQSRMVPPLHDKRGGKEAVPALGDIDELPGLCRALDAVRCWHLNSHMWCGGQTAGGVSTVSAHVPTAEPRVVSRAEPSAVVPTAAVPPAVCRPHAVAMIITRSTS